MKTDEKKRSIKKLMLKSKAIIVLMLASVFVLTVGCDKPKTEPTASEEIKKNEPQVDIKVDRKYDDKGNMIGFDSTYLSFYSNQQPEKEIMDSLFRKFNESLLTDSTYFQHRMHSLFFRDTLIYPDFFHEDFFSKRYELNDKYLRKMMHEMDSIKNRFYEDLSKQPEGKKVIKSKHALL